MPAVTVPIERNAEIRTWFRVGGPARRLARPRSLGELRQALDIDQSALVLGDGANLLVADEGVDQLVIDLQHLNRTEINATTVTAQAGARLPTLVTKTAKHGLAGLHTVAGVPASIGGAVVMNAGGTHGQISDTLTSITAVTRAGEPITKTRDQIPFAYRHAGLTDLIILGATFELTKADPAALAAEVKAIMNAKKQSQPLAERSAGCCFKNPTLTHDIDTIGQRGQRISAGLLIDRAGCKSLRLRTAGVSPIHANFITADRTDGKANDIIELIHEVQRRVHDTFGVHLEREVVIWPPVSSPAAGGGGDPEGRRG